MAEVWEAIQAMEAPEETDTGGALDSGLDDRDDLRRRWLGTKPAQLIATGRQLCIEPDRVAELAATRLPVHVLSGSLDDTWPVPLLDDMAVRLQGAANGHRAGRALAETPISAATARALADFWDAR